jgi:protein-tyrosine phosphatase
MTLGPRVTPLGGAKNFRHIGDYAVGDGRSTRADRLLRTGWMDLSEPGESARFQDHKVSMVIDLRLPNELAQQPLRLPNESSLRVVGLGIEQGSMAGYLRDLSKMTPEQADTKGAMARMYYEMLDEAQPQFRQFFAEAAESAGPLLIMCTLGKDRTGVAVALLLAALGVRWDDILSDYMISAEALRGYDEVFAQRANLAASGINLELVRDMLTVHPEYLEGVRRRAEEISGSLEAFIAGPLGVTAEQKQRLLDLYCA